MTRFHLSRDTWLALLLLLASATGKHHVGLPHHITAAPGAVIEDIGRVFTINQHIEIQYKLAPLHEFKEALKEQLKALLDLDNMIASDSVLDGSERSILLSSLMATIHELSSFILPPQTEINNRHKRGLLDFVGVMAHGLFGVVDESTLSDRLGEYTSKLNTVVKSFDDSAHALNALEHNVKQMKASFDQMSSNIKEITTAMNNVARFSRISFHLLQYQMTVLKVTHAASDLLAAVLLASNGQVTPKLITPHDFRNVIRNISLDADNPLVPLFPLSKRTLFYTSLHSYLTDEGLSILVPLKPSNTLEAFRIHTFPNKMNDTYYTLRVDHTIILKTIRGQALATPHTSFLDSCQRPTPRIYACYTPSLVYDIDSPSCHRALVVQRHRVAEQCKFDEIKPTEYPYIIPLADVSLLYYFFPTSSTVTCDSKPITKPISGIFLLPHSCELSSLSFQIPAVKHYVTTFEKEPLIIQPGSIYIPEFTANITKLTLQPMHNVPGIPFFPTYHAIYMYPVYITVAGMILVLIAITSLLCCIRNRNRQAHYRGESRNYTTPSAPPSYDGVQ